MSTTVSVATNHDNQRESPEHILYTNDDRRNLLDWLAKHYPQKQDRQSLMVWNQLQKDPAAAPWSKRHSPSTWRDWYAKNKDSYDEAIERRRRTNPLPNRIADRETKEDINLLAKYFAAHDIAEDIRSRADVYQALKTNKREDWTTKRSVIEWREFYQKHHEAVDARARQIGYFPHKLSISTTIHITNQQDERDIEQLARHFAQQKIEEGERIKATFYYQLRNNKNLDWVEGRIAGEWRTLYISNQEAIDKRVKELGFSTSERETPSQTISKRQHDPNDRLEIHRAKRRRVEAPSALDTPSASKENRINGSTRQNGKDNTNPSHTHALGSEKNHTATNGVSIPGTNGVDNVTRLNATTIVPGTPSPKNTPAASREHTPKPPTAKLAASAIIASALNDRPAYQAENLFIAPTPDASQVNGTPSQYQDMTDQRDIPNGIQQNGSVPINGGGSFGTLFGKIFPSSLPSLSPVLWRQRDGSAANRTDKAPQDGERNLEEEPGVMNDSHYAMDPETVEFQDDIEIPSPMPNLGDDKISSHPYSFSRASPMHLLNFSAPPNSYPEQTQPKVQPNDEIHANEAAPVPAAATETVVEESKEPSRPQPRYFVPRKRTRRPSDSPLFASGSSDKEEKSVSAAVNGIHRPVTNRTTALGVVRERGGRTSLDQPRNHSVETPSPQKPEPVEILGNDEDKENVPQTKRQGRTNVALDTTAPKRENASISAVRVAPSSPVTFTALADAVEDTPLAPAATSELDLNGKTPMASKPVSSLKNKTNPKSTTSSVQPVSVRGSGVSGVSNPALVYPSPHVSPSTEKEFVGREEPSPLNAAGKFKVSKQDLIELVPDSDAEDVESGLKQPSNLVPGHIDSDKGRHAKVRFESVALDRNQRRKTTGGFELAADIEHAQKAQKRSVFSDEKSYLSNRGRAGLMAEDGSFTARLLQGPRHSDGGDLPHKPIHTANTGDPVHSIKAQQPKTQAHPQPEIIDLENDEGDEEGKGLDEDDSPLARYSAPSRAFSSPAKRTRQSQSGRRSTENENIPPPPRGIPIPVITSSSPLPPSSPAPPSTAPRKNQIPSRWPSTSALPNKPQNVSIHDLAVPQWSPVTFRSAKTMNPNPVNQFTQANTSNQSHPSDLHSQENNVNAANTASGSNARNPANPVVTSPPTGGGVPSVLEFRDQVADAEWVETARGRPRVTSRTIDPRRRSAPLPTPNEVEVYSSSSPARPSKPTRRYSDSRSKVPSQAQLSDEADESDGIDEDQESQDDQHDPIEFEADSTDEEEPDASVITPSDKAQILEFLRWQDPDLDWNDPSEVPHSVFSEGLSAIFEHWGETGGLGSHLPRVLWMKCGDLDQAYDILMTMAKAAKEAGSKKFKEERKKKMREEEDRRQRWFKKSLSRSHSRRTSLSARSVADHSRSRSRRRSRPSLASRQSRQSGDFTVFVDAEENENQDPVLDEYDESTHRRNSSRSGKGTATTGDGAERRHSRQSKSSRPPSYIPAELWDDLGS